MSGWPDPHVAILKDLRAKGWSAAQIANEINRLHRTAYSRNAVIGKAIRLGMMHVPASKPAQAKGSLGAVRRTRAKSAIYGGDPKTSPLQKRLDAVAANVSAQSAWVDRPEPAGKVTIAELQAHHCRWPVGDPSSDGFRMCGDQQLIGSSYCPAHKARSVVKTSPPPPTLAGATRQRRTAA